MPEWLEIIEALSSMARSRVTHESDFLWQWIEYADHTPVTEAKALAALDWLDGLLIAEREGGGDA